MMLGLNGRPAEVDVFQYFLAKELGMTVSQLQDVPHDEYVGWQGFFKAKHAIENQRAVN